MAKTIESRTVTADDVFGFSPPALQGYGTLTTTMYSNIDQKASDMYVGSDWASVFWVNNDAKVYLDIEGQVSDTTTDDDKGWTQMVIGSTTFLRSAATFTRLYQSSNIYYKYVTRWEWSVASSPFPTSGTTTVKWEHAGSVPSFAPITANEIHLEAGGSTGTLVSINDADVRAKSWYARVPGSTPVSGQQQDFADFYYPLLFGADMNGTTYPVRLMYTDESQFWNTGVRTGYNQADYIRSRDGGTGDYTHDGMLGAAVQADGTDTIIYMVLAFYNTGQSLRQYFDKGDTARTVSSVLTEVYRIEGVSCDSAALVSVIPSGGNGVDTTNGTLYTVEDPTTGNNGGATWTNAAYISTNSISSFTSLSDTSKRYGHQYRVRHIGDAAGDVVVSNLRINCTFRLRKEPSDTAGFWYRDISMNLRLYLETDTTP